MNETRTPPESRYSIGQLADMTGISRRAVRYYVQRGLIPPPLGGGRGHYYSGQHLERLQSIRSLQGRGWPLERIARHLGGGEPADTPPVMGNRELPSPTAWVRLPIDVGIELHVESGRARVTPTAVEELRRAARRILGLDGSRHHSWEDPS